MRGGEAVPAGQGANSAKRTVLTRFLLGLAVIAASNPIHAQVFRYPQPPISPTPQSTIVENRLARLDTILSSEGLITRVDTITMLRLDTVMVVPVVATADGGSFFKMLSEGQVGVRGSNPLVGLNLIELYIAPDIAKWNWSIPIILLSSNTVDAAQSDPKRVAADLLDAFAGALNASISGHWEKRGTRADGEKSITGLYVDFGGIGRANSISSANGGGSGFYASVGPHARADFRITTKTKPDAASYSGVIHARVAVTGNYVVRRHEGFDALFGANFKHASALEIDIGWFPFESASINILKYTTALGEFPSEFKNRFSSGVSLFPR